MWTYGYRCAARRANAANVDFELGAQLGAAAAVRPARCAPQRDERRDPAPMEACQHRVVARPGPGALAWLDLAPVDRHADDIHSQPIEPIQAVADRAGAVREPCVVLDAVANGRRRLRERTAAQEPDHGDKEDPAHRGTVRGLLESDVRRLYGSLGGSRPSGAKRERSDGGLRHMPRIGSPTASIRARIVSTVNASGSTRRPRPSAAARKRAHPVSAAPSTRRRSSGRARSGRSRRRRRRGRPPSTSSSRPPGRRPAARPPRRSPSQAAARRETRLGRSAPGCAGRSRPTSSGTSAAQLVHHLLHDERDLAHVRPLAVARRVEVDQEVIRPLDLRHARVPRVQLDAAEVRDPGERRGVVDDREHGRVPARKLRRRSRRRTRDGSQAPASGGRTRRRPRSGTASCGTGGVGGGGARSPRRRRSTRRGRPCVRPRSGKKILSGFVTGTSYLPRRIQRVSWSTCWKGIR